MQALQLIKQFFLAAIAFVLGYYLVTIVAVPTAKGWTTHSILSGSMEPKIHPGDLIVTSKTSFDNIKVGDIITFQPKSNDPTLITHRVIAKQMGGVERLTTQGDANGAADTPIKPEQIMGKYEYTVPKAGHVIQPAKNAMGNKGPLLMMVLVGGCTFWILASMGDKSEDDKKEDKKVEEE